MRRAEASFVAATFVSKVSTGNVVVLSNTATSAPFSGYIVVTLTGLSARPAKLTVMVWFVFCSLPARQRAPAGISTVYFSPSLSSVSRNVTTREWLSVCEIANPIELRTVLPLLSFSMADDAPPFTLMFCVKRNVTVLIQWNEEPAEGVVVKSWRRSMPWHASLMFSGSVTT